VTRRSHARSGPPPVVGGDPDAKDWLDLSVAVTWLSRLLAQIGAADLAVALTRALIRLEPHELAHRPRLVELLLRRGEYAAAWPEQRHEARMRRGPLDRLRFGSHPAWTPGEDLAGRTLLIATDIGLGDMLWHARYVPLLAQLAAKSGGQIVVETVPALARLLRHSFKGMAEFCARPPIHTTRPPVVPYDLWCLPNDPAEVFANDPTALPSAPYLRADPALVNRWRTVIEREAGGGGLRVALCWAGDPALADDPRRMRLADLALLRDVQGVTLVSVQKSVSRVLTWQRPADGGPEDERTPAGMQLLRLGPRLDDLADTAAVLAAVDLVVTVDTSVAHLAGALGRPTWLLLHAWPWGGWGSEPETTRWYPSVRLFRQQRYGEWGRVAARVAAELAGMVRRRDA
jgi:hypothetical protein